MEANCSEDFSPQDGHMDAWIRDVWQTAGGRGEKKQHAP